MSYRKIWFTFFTSLFSLITFFLAAQQSDLSFNHLTVENGLPIGHVLSIFEDSRGFVWFGTDDGLCRFDGIHCKMYKHDEKDSSSIRGTRIGNMVEDKNGNLWITSDDALNCYVRAHDSFRSFRINAGTESNNFIYAVFALKNDSVVIIQNATHQLYDFNISSKTFSRTDSLGYFRLLLNQSVLRGNHIAVLSNETGNGISIWHFDHDVPVREDFFTLETHSKLTDLPLGQIVVESDSLVWLNCEKGLVAFNPSTKNYRIYNPLQNDFPVFTLLFERGNELLIGSNEGLWIFNKFQRKFTTHFQHEDSNSESLSGNIISDAGLLDHNNNLWIEVFAKGIDYVNLNKKKFNHYLDEKEAKEKGIDNFVRCMAEDSEGDVWCGTMQNKLYVFDKQKNLIEDYSKDITGANSASVVYLFRDKQNRMWVINNQLFVFDPGRKTFQSVSGVHTAVNIAQLHDGTIVFTEWRQGIFKLKEAGGNFSVEPTAIKGLFSERQAMYEDHQNYLYVCAPDLSLRVYSSLNDSIPIHTLKIHAEVKSFYESNDDSTLWIATSEGLVKLNKKNFKFSMITSKDGLPNDFVYAVLPDEQGNLWLSTNSGICKFNSLEFSFKNFTTRDGLQSNEFNTNGYVLCHDGEMWFSGVNGFNAFYPEKIKDDSITPSVQITAMKVNDEPFNSPNYIGETSALTLPFSERTVSFDFTAINFSEPKNVKLEYRLSGIDASWISTSNPGFARYPNLPSGNYQFQIKAANSDGIWNPQMKSLQLIIQTPFYRTWWFMMLIVLIIAALLYSIYRYRVNQILKLHAVRNRIARDLHDDIGSSLSSIRIMSELVSKQKNLEKSAEMMNKIGNESQQAMDAIRDIVWSVNPDNDSLDNMWLRMQEYAAEILEAKNITYHFEANDHLEQLKLPMNHRRDFYLIFKEAINNLSKYSGAQNVAITLHHESKRLLLKIKDDGRGFDASSSMNGNGIRNMKKRADQLNGKISIASENGIGTSIVLEVPVT